MLISSRLLISRRLSIHHRGKSLMFSRKSLPNWESRMKEMQKSSLDLTPLPVPCTMDRTASQEYHLSPSAKAWTRLFT